jgi:vacuolar iron transporter family protein
MKTTTLGRSGLEVSRIAFGTWQLGGDWGEFDEDAAVAAIRRARELGVNFFDTVLTDRDAIAAHVDVELGINPDDLSNPWQAALSSAVAFTLGAIVPLIAILLPPVGARVPVAFLSVLIAFVLTGTVSAALGGARRMRAVMRIVLGGTVAMVVTFGIGQMVGATI